jgi:agmatinase
MATTISPDYNTYGGLSEKLSSYHAAEIVILPVAFDQTSSWQKGSAKGPAAIIEASKYMELYDIETDSEVYLRGIHTADPLTPDSSVALNQQVFQTVNQILTDRKYVITLGGEHSVSVGTILAHQQHYPQMCVLQLDAHADLRDSYDGNPFNHACVMARVKEKIKQTVAVGIRSMDASERNKLNPNCTVFAAELEDNPYWIDKTLANLNNDVYVTIDLDVLDCAIMPSTGTPEPGGLSWFQLINLLKNVALHKNIVGFDVVELCPSENKAPDYLAAKLIYKLLSYIYQNHNK